MSTCMVRRRRGGLSITMFIRHVKIEKKSISTLTGSEERFLNVTTDKTDIEERGGFDAKWVINISSYPTALDFTWRKVNSGEIGRDPDDPKYQIDRKGPLVVLKILNASLKDSGAYQFLVRLRDFSDVFKTLELRLTVLGEQIMCL